MTNYTFQSLFDFTRTTSGTFVGSNGLIQTTPASVNLLTWTQEFDNAAWTKGAGVTVTANAVVAPDGTSTADNIAFSAGGAGEFVRGSAALTVGVVYTVSIYARLISGTPTFTFDAGNIIVSGAQTPTASWQRFSFTFTFSGANQWVDLQTSAAGTIAFWGAQLQTGSTATDYTRNNGGVYPARFDYDPATLQPKGILIEEQRVNLLTYSEQFDNAAWTKVNATVTANATASPDGTTNADKLVETATTSDHRIEGIVSFTTGTAYTFSFYAKAGERTVISARSTTVWASDPRIRFTLTGSGTVTVDSGTPTGTITAVGNGWYRCTMTATTNATAPGAFWLSLYNGAYSYAGDGTSGLFIYGAQVEAGAFATSYIPTVASQVTRAADQCSIVAPLFAPWYNQSEGTLLVEASLSPSVDGPSGNYYVAISDGTTSNSIHIVDVDGTISQVVTSGVTQFNQTVGAEPTGILKAALAYANNNTVSSANGAIGATDTSVSIPTVNRINLGVNAGLFAALNGHIRSIQYYPVRLADFQLQALTA